jgi:hypothetical protein
MEKELKAETTPPPLAPRRVPKPLWIPPDTRKPPVIEIHPISGATVNTICKKYSNYKLFTITIQELDSLINQYRDMQSEQ